MIIVKNLVLLHYYYVKIDGQTGSGKTHTMGTTGYYYYNNNNNK